MAAAAGFKIATVGGASAQHLRRSGQLQRHPCRCLRCALTPDTGARFVPLEGRNHILLADEPGWAQALCEVRPFLAPSKTQAWDGLRELSNRELDVLSLAAKGLNNEEIAARLYLSVRTIERHLSNIYAKLGVSGKAARAAAAARFSRSGEAALGD